MASMILRPGIPYTMRVSFTVPHSVTIGEVKDFIEDWLQGGGGCRHPDDPLFDSLQDVKTALVRRSAKG